ncbi:C40 family peptidase [Paenibacillus dokdonensis]|uniref:C40 family peptidase n=1 Tax=Paenibacillus dokdonensis TaxID=2567944 RepID=UPI0010A8513E|nr:C40 family peptidase [Paenibacillus dokdonensis]
MTTTNLIVTLTLFQKDFFTRKKRVFTNIGIITRNTLNYLPLKDVMEILEYDTLKNCTNSILITDGSELVTIPQNGAIAKREGVSFRIDPLIMINKERFISLRSVNRLLNVDFLVNRKAKRVSIRQPGRFIITIKGDTFKKLSRLLNTSVKKLLSVNKDLKEPIPPGIKVTIPTIDFDAIPQRKSTGMAKIKQEPEKAPAIIALGRSLIGTRYQFGAGPYPRSKRFDCSSFTQYIFGKNGIVLPRTSSSQARYGRTITQKDIEPGDLIFFRRDRYSDNRIGHVGVDIGNGNMINTYQSPPGVTITKWRSPYWLKRYVTAREIL